MARPVTVGLLGGIASGKSTVAAELARLGAHVIDADRVAHRVLRDGAVKQKIRRRWGDEAFTRSGAVDRKKLAARAFATKREQQALVRITHPPILRSIRDEIAHVAHRRQPQIVVLDAALLAESGLAELCDITVFVSCDQERRTSRATAERGWPPGEVERRERYQRSLNEKQRCAGYVLHNCGTRRALLAQVRRLYAELTRRLEGTATSKSS